MTRRVPYVFTANTSAANTSPWILTDYSFDQNPVRAYAGTNTSGGTFTIQVAVSINKINANVSVTYVETLLTTTSATYNGLIQGNWPAIRLQFSGGDTGGSHVLLMK